MVAAGKTRGVAAGVVRAWPWMEMRVISPVFRVGMEDFAT
jgi:hypothetical protein